MITSKQIINQLEQYSDTKNVAGHPVIIYENPTSSDILEISKSTKSSPKEVRFIADPDTHKIYIWDAYLAIHRDILKQIGLKPSSWEVPILFGEATISGTTLIYKYSDSMKMWVEMVTGPVPVSARPQDINHEPRKDNWLVKYVNSDWSWADRYINGLSNFMRQQIQVLNNWINKN
jgi:hypothetical protein